ncbi:hypothetical protein J5X84_20070 [Streptosporangiaceae bacterium NEAU-GS5]|nr:hypothetical protein [Streptosporangiaceae bacterium NEAU-GS5]
MPDIADQLPTVLLKAAEAHIRAAGTSPRPQVHILAEDLQAAYLGYMVCRRFYRGADAASALANLGVLPSVIKATRLFVVWEESDLRTALEIQGERTELGIAILDARSSSHTLHWHPFNAQVGSVNSRGESTIVVTWHTPAHYENVPLLAPIEALLKVWREPRYDDLERTAAELEEAGYELNWAIPLKE